MHPRGKYWGQILLDLFANDLDNGADWTISKFAGDIKLGRVADIPDSCSSIHRDAVRLEVGQRRISRSSKRGNAMSCICGGITPRTNICCLAGKQLCWEGPWGHNHEPERHLHEKEGQQPPELHLTERCQQVILPLHFTLLRPHLECSVQFWAPQYRRDRDLLKWVLQKITKMVKRLDLLSCSFYNLDKGRLRGSLSMCL